MYTYRIICYCPWKGNPTNMAVTVKGTRADARREAGRKAVMDTDVTIETHKTWIDQSGHGIAEIPRLTDPRGTSGQTRCPRMQKIFSFQIHTSYPSWPSTRWGIRKCVQQPISSLNMLQKWEHISGWISMSIPRVAPQHVPPRQTRMAQSPHASSKSPHLTSCLRPKSLVESEPAVIQPLRHLITMFKGKSKKNSKHVRLVRNKGSSNSSGSFIPQQKIKKISSPTQSDSETMVSDSEESNSVNRTYQNPIVCEHFHLQS